MNDALQKDAQAARAEVQAGSLRGPALVERLLAVPYFDRDMWTDELLGLPKLPPDSPDLPRGSVPYLPAAVEDILSLVLEAPLREEDELVDIGSGIGRVVMLAHLLSGASARGIEIQAPLVDTSRACCDRLGLSEPSFVQANAADVELDGSVFFLYSPFSGPSLDCVMRKLNAVARRRSIVVCAVGFDFPAEQWLVPRPTTSPALTLYDSQFANVPRRSRLRDWYAVPSFRRGGVPQPEAIRSP